MVTEITSKEVMTLREIKEKYADKWFRYVIVDDTYDEDPEDRMCYVVLTADTEDELYKHPYPDKNKLRGGISTGDDVEFPMEVGGIYVHV